MPNFRELLVALLIVVIIAATFILGCDWNRNEPAPQHGVVVPGTSTTPGRYDWSKVNNSGNHSYIPLDIEGRPADHTGEILNALTSYEVEHPNLRVTNWWIEKQGTGGGYDKVRGLWVDHLPRETTNEKK